MVGSAVGQTISTDDGVDRINGMAWAAKVHVCACAYGLGWVGVIGVRVLCENVGRGHCGVFDVPCLSVRASARVSQRVRECVRACCR